MRKLVLSLLLLVASVAFLYSQATLVQQTQARLDTATQVATSATSAATLTLTPSGSQSVVIWGIDVQNCAGATAVTAAAPTTITTTNISGSPAWTLGSGVTAGLCTQSYSVTYSNGLKSQTPGTAVTFVLPAFATNQTVRLNVAWSSAPTQ